MDKYRCTVGSEEEVLILPNDVWTLILRMAKPNTYMDQLYCLDKNSERLKPVLVRERQAGYKRAIEAAVIKGVN